jgi:hypothetical protein
MRAIPRLIGTVAIVLGGIGAVSAQGPGREPKRVAPSLDAVLPQLNSAVVRLRSGATPVTGIRVQSDLAVVMLPVDAPAPDRYSAAVFDNWTAAPIVARDADRSMVLVRVPPAAAAPALKSAALPATAGFVVGAANLGPNLDIRTVWVEPGETPAVAPGAAVFAVDGAFLGVLQGRSLVPAADILKRAAALTPKA